MSQCHMDNNKKEKINILEHKKILMIKVMTRTRAKKIN